MSHLCSCLHIHILAAGRSTHDSCPTRISLARAGHMTIAARESGLPCLVLTDFALGSIMGLSASKKGRELWVTWLSSKHAFQGSGPKTTQAKPGGHLSP